MVALLAYGASVISRRGSYSSAIDGWALAIGELAASLLCIAVSWSRPRVRPVGVVLGCALLSWSLGDLAMAANGGANSTGFSLADGFYIGFYPLAYAAVGLGLRSQLRRLPWATWLDGVVASLGAAAMCAAFAFHRILDATGTTTVATATNLAYPMGDLLLLGLVVGANAIVPGRRKAMWALLSVGMAIVAVGDTVNLFSSSLAATEAGSVVNSVAWPVAILLMAAAPWLDRPSPGTFALERAPGFAIPGVAATCALGMVFFGTLRHVNTVALGLAAATLLVAGARLLFSVRALRAVSQHRHDQAITDDLTGLRNRRYLSQLLDDYFARRDIVDRRQHDMAFMFVDLNHFKEINDSFGHPAGDELLRQLGPRLQKCLRSSDVVVRLGGDEFGILLPEGGADRALAVARRIAEELQQPFELFSLEARIGASIGVALASQVTSPFDLMRGADMAMYQAKQGGSPFAVYGDGPKRTQGVQLVEQLRAALTSGQQLALHYQPLMDLRQGRVTGVEALLRWSHPELGMVAPLQFLPIAEEAGLMPQLTQFVLREALAQVARWRAGGEAFSVSVNISASDLLEANFVQVVSSLLEEHHLAANALVLEITETCVIRDFGRLRLVVEALAGLGATVSIDDFGAGATSLTYLSSLTGVGELKLDRSFITDLAAPDRQRDLELVRATIELGHALGLRVVAEGIEDAPTLDVLAELGCDLAQGYYISRPQPAHELTAALGSAPVPA